MTPDDSEFYCHRCGGPCIPWTAPSPLWNLVMRGNDINGNELHDGIVCAQCFMELASHVATGWRLYAATVTGDPKLETPSGRIWNPETWLWEEHGAAPQVR